MTPIVHGLQEEFANQVEIQLLNVGLPENEAIQQQYELRGHPTMVLINADGEKIHQFFGVVDEMQLRTALQDLIP